MSDEYPQATTQKNSNDMESSHYNICDANQPISPYFLIVCIWITQPDAGSADVPIRNPPTAFRKQAFRASRSVRTRTS